MVPFFSGHGQNMAGQKKAKLVMSAIESYDIVDGGLTQTNVATAGEQL